MRGPLLSTKQKKIVVSFLNENSIEFPMCSNSFVWRHKNGPSDDRWNMNNKMHKLFSDRLLKMKPGLRESHNLPIRSSMCFSSSSKSITSGSPLILSELAGLFFFLLDGILLLLDMDGVTVAKSLNNS